MASLNQVYLLGNLTRDPEGRRTNSGMSTCSLSLAVNRKYKKGNGELVEEATFVDIDTWDKTADFCRDYLKKGSSILVSGRLSLDSWVDRTTGAKRSKLKVVADRVQSLSGGQKQEQQPQSPVAQPQPATAPPAFEHPAEEQLPGLGAGEEDINSIPI